MSDEWDKKRVEADVAQFKNAVEDATVEEVDVPDGRKDVEIAWEDEDGFHCGEGQAIGVYRETETLVHIDWSDGRDRTTVPLDQIVTLNEGEYYIESE